MEITMFQAVTMAVAAVGAVLGVMNTWRSFDRDRVKVLVKPQFAADQYGIGLCVQVVNLSGFPVTVTHVGFTVRDAGRHFQYVPNFLDREPLPRRMESRTSLTTIVPSMANHLQEAQFITAAYVETACGLRITGKSSALTQFVKQCAAAAQAQ